MAKRTIQECDLTKQEYDPDETVIITIKKKGKTKGRSYDLCPEAAAKLEQQLVAGSDAILDDNWEFISTPGEETYELYTIGEKEPTIVTLADDDIEDDSNFVAAKKAELKQQGVTNEDNEPRETTNSVFKDSGNCAHMNRGRPQLTIRNGKRHAYTICKDCHKQLPIKKRDERAAYKSDKPPSDVNVRDLGE